MGCITVKVAAINEPISVKVGAKLTPLTVKTSIVSEPLKVNVGLICTPDINVYLKATPTSIEIPVTGTAVYVKVYTNTTYKVY